MSTSEWMPSETMADEPLRAAAMNLMIAIARLPRTAATTAIFEPPCVVMGDLPLESQGWMSGWIFQH